MRTSQRALVVFFALILMQTLVASSSMLVREERRVHTRERNQHRRLLVSVASFVSNPKELSKTLEDTQRSVETSLRKAPSSKSNPIQNKFHFSLIPFESKLHAWNHLSNKYVLKFHLLLRRNLRPLQLKCFVDSG
ncbi:hypothetical protein TorRG33x02_030620 [Trema orientale]|uniref:Uncharacterized protein n=1 Tax=Trema orientale TaxID=63057 RepID=A0A2P5FU26_TREOI|nr:hypothetical protein TorRG33x02_030620 [Trema orientale]